MIARHEAKQAIKQVLDNWYRQGELGSDALASQLWYLDLHIERYMDVLRLLQIGEGSTVLDVGIGSGQLAILVQKCFGCRVVGIDLKTRFEKPLLDLGITTAKCDLERDPIPYGDEVFDTIIFSEVLEHLLLDPKALFRDLSRVLKREGSLVLTTPNAASFQNIKKNLRQTLTLVTGSNIYPDLNDFWKIRIREGSRPHVREYTLKELTSLIEAAGLEVDVVHMSRAWDRPKGTRLTFALTAFVPRLRSCIMLRAKKLALETTSRTP